MRLLRPVPMAGTGPPPTTPCDCCSLHHDGPVGLCAECAAVRDRLETEYVDELVRQWRDLQERVWFAEARLAAKEAADAG